MKVLGLLWHAVLCVCVCEVKTNEMRINDVMDLIKHVIDDVAQMNTHFQKTDDELNKKIENVEINTIERVSRVEKIIASVIEEKIESLELKTIERVQKLSERFTENLRIRDIQMKQDLDLRDLQMSKLIKRMKKEFSHRLDEEHQQIEILKGENAAMKEEMKKCIGGKDLSKNVSILVEKQSDLEAKQLEQDKVLHILQNKIDKTITDGANISKKIQSLNTNLSHLRKGNEELKSGVECLNNTMSVLKDDIKSEVSKREDAMKTIQIVQAEEGKKLADIRKTAEDTHQVVDAVSECVEELKHDAKEMNASMICFKKEVNEKLSDMSKMNITILNTEVIKNTKEIRKTNKNMNQMQMYLRYNSTELGLTFKDILDLAGEENFMEKKSKIVQKLIQQKEEFGKHQKYWDISFKDVIRLTDGSELKEGRNLTTVMKLLALNNLFTSTYKTKWGIEFKDLIRLTTKEDMKGIPLEDDRNSIPILEKIDQLFNAFRVYKDLWKVNFKDIVDLTENLRFTDATKSPALVMVKSWYVPGFADVWGESFNGFFHIMKSHPSKRSDFLKKIKKVVEKERKKRFLKMLPGRFIYDGTTLSVNGYIQVFYEGRYSEGMVRGNGTVWIHGQGRHYRFTDATATTLCAIGGYSYTQDGWSDGKYRNGKSDDRSKLNCFLSGIQCMGLGTETDLSQCIIDPDSISPPPTTTKPGLAVSESASPSEWNHSEDVAIKCNL